MSELQEIGTEVPTGAVVVHEPHGFVHLVECNADDLMVVNAARVSFRKRSDWASPGEVTSGEWVGQPWLSDVDEKVLRFLLKNKHGTPFEQTFFTFHVRAPIFLFREWHRHRIGVSINEESGRYVQLRPDFYVPDRDHVRTQQGRPGAYVFEREPDDEKAAMTQRHMADMYARCYETYEIFLRRGVAKEIARTVLPVGIYSQMYWTCNARSLMNFLALRNHDRALRELRDYAGVMEQMFAEKMPITHDAFVKNGRTAP